ncbi:MAG TPA: hypothetical protein VGY98_09850 [Verrucomicrobiae bacterium]|nr:hypothetical protein [Verrucomicrobiae bacterium]
MGFREEVEATPNLQGKWTAGLGALRAQDKARIKPENTSAKHLRGSVDIDSAWQQVEPQANRWDFAVGYKHVNRSDEFVYWVETHTGSDEQIKVMFRKLDWLKNWLKNAGKRLANFDRSFVWVPGGATSFTKGSTQVRSLAEKGLLYSGSTFRIPVTHEISKP